jgi:2-C-methyl-D-erythritol 4-phosphate cytidylyltransferase
LIHIRDGTIVFFIILSPVAKGFFKINDQTLTQDEYALIVAGGKGTRFGSSVPKQFLELNGKPVLLHTLEAFYRYSSDIRIVLVLPEEDIGTWEDIATRNRFDRSLVVKAGGPTRCQSVRNGLQMIGDSGYVAVHDGVRPLVTTEIIDKSFRLARLHQSAVASVSLQESLRIVQRAADNSVATTRAVDRSEYRLIQTPQTFDLAILKRAYEIQDNPALTDDASVVEKAGYPIFLFDGDYRNIKITNREDLVVAEALLKGTGRL